MGTGATYEYNDNGQLIEVWWDDGSRIVYQYDALGNRLVVEEEPSCCNRFTLYSKSGSFDADDGAGSYYHITASATVTLPESPADGSVMKFKVTAGTSNFSFNGAETFNHANGVSDQNLSITSNSGVVEIIAVANGWDET